MAPEQLTGKPVDVAADLFSLGCVLYRMAADKRPFGGDDLLSVVRVLALDVPAPLEDLNPQVPRRLSDLVAKLLAKSPDDRPATTQAVLDELKLIEQELSPQPAAPATAARPSGKVRSRSPSPQKLVHGLRNRPRTSFAVCLLPVWRPTHPHRDKQRSDCPGDRRSVDRDHRTGPAGRRPRRARPGRDHSGGR